MPERERIPLKSAQEIINSMRCFRVSQTGVLGAFFVYAWNLSSPKTELANPGKMTLRLIMNNSVEQDLAENESEALDLTENIDDASVGFGGRSRFNNWKFVPAKRNTNAAPYYYQSYTFPR